ncbi:GIN domain-containing protein [Bacteroides stercorirosoris]|nr:DUF2807 domain-containing protein [Bacteroides stercorirosoris]
MKTIFLSLSLVFAAISANGYAANGEDSKVTENRKVASFSSIDVTSVPTIYFTQGDTYSLRIEGREKSVKSTTTQIKNGCLFIVLTEPERNISFIEGLKIYLTAPDLKKVKLSTLGSFICESPLILKDVALEAQSVGELKLKLLTCQSLSISVNAVGSINISVDCDDLQTNMNGIGSVVLNNRR